jgi:hypothetical protein
MNDTLLGHNSAGILVTTQVRMFNSISRFAGPEGIFRKLVLPAGSAISDVLRELRIPAEEIFLIFVNGRDITPTLGDVRTTYVIEDGDVIALSGPVPYSWGYGAPVV